MQVPFGQLSSYLIALPKKIEMSAGMRRTWEGVFLGLVCMGGVRGVKVSTAST